jgi:hypothetical protein
MSVLILTAITAMATLGAAIAAYLNAKAMTNQIKKIDEYRNNDRLLQHAIQQLERGYEILVGTGGVYEIMKGDKAGFGKLICDKKLPPPDRLAWVTTAKLIIEFQKTKELIFDKVSIRECQSHEDYWRHRFHLIIFPLTKAAEPPLGNDRKISLNYYYSHLMHPLLPEIIIIHAFSDFNATTSDVIKVHPDVKDMINAWAPSEIFKNLYSIIKAKNEH